MLIRTCACEEGNLLRVGHLLLLLYEIFSCNQVVFLKRLYVAYDVVVVVVDVLLFQIGNKPEETDVRYTNVVKFREEAEVSILLSA